MVLFQWVLGCCWCSLSRVLEEGRQLKRMAPRFVVVTSSHLQASALLDELGPFQGWDLSELSCLDHSWPFYGRLEAKQDNATMLLGSIHTDPQAFTLSKDRSRRGFSWFLRWLCNRSAPLFRWSSSRGCLWRVSSFLKRLGFIFGRVVLCGVEAVQSICHGLHIAQTCTD